MKARNPTCADKLKILADTTRLAVLESLMDQPKHVSELGHILDIEQSLLSHHLAQLREAGFVQATRDGKAMLYQLAPNISTASEERHLTSDAANFRFLFKRESTNNDEA